MTAKVTWTVDMPFGWKNISVTLDVSNKVEGAVEDSLEDSVIPFAFDGIF